MRRRIAVSAALVFLATESLPAQQATFRSKTELIVVDAVVVDKDGNAVRGLKKSDFALTDRKKPQVIETFEEVSHERARAGTAPVPALPLTLKLDVASNMTVQADRLVMVVIDDLHIWKGRTDKARALAQDIVTNLGNQASMAVVFTGGEGSTEVTQDRSVLLAAIGGMQGRQSVRRPRESLSPRRPRIDAGASMDKALDDINRAGRASLEDLFANSQYLATMTAAASTLKEENRRRKALVVISEGMNQDLSRIAGGESDLAEMGTFDSSLSADMAMNTLVPMMTALRRANVAVYAIDPRGKVRSEDIMRESWPPPDCAVCNNPPALPLPAERVEDREDSMFAWHNPVRVAQAGLGFTSDATGGFAVTDTDDLTGGLGRILQDLDHYYLLGFYPANTTGGKDTHPVGLTVPGHPEYTLRFRRGYTPDGPSSPPLKESTSKDPLAALAARVMPTSDLPLRLTAMPLPGDGKIVSVAVALEVTAPVTLIKDADKKLRDDITYSVMVVDGKKAKVTQRTGRSATFSLRATDPDKPEPDEVSYQIPLLMDLPPGRYQLRASAISRKLGKGGSVYLDVTVPDFPKIPLALTPIAIGFQGGPRVPVGRTAGSTGPFPPGVATMGPPSTRAAPAAPVVPHAAVSPDLLIPPAQARAQNSKNPLPFEPTLNREFVPRDVLQTYFEVARMDVTTSVALEIRVLAATDVMLLRYDAIIPPRDHGRIHLQIPLQTLGPGAYTVRVTGSDGRNTARTETGFVIR